MDEKTYARFGHVMADVRAAANRTNRVMKTFAWLLNHRKADDVEEFAFRLADRHIREGRPDLAAEDLEWLAGRY